MVPPTRPFFRCRSEQRRGVHVLESSVLLVVARQCDLVRPRNIDPDPVIREALRRVEVKHEEEACALVRDDLVALVLERDVRLRAGEPVVLGVEVVHGGIEGAEVLVPEQIVVKDVPLSTSVLEGAVVALAREVEPLSMIVSLVTDQELDQEPTSGWPDSLPSKLR
jgi:hypothetical protein